MGKHFFFISKCPPQYHLAGWKCFCSCVSICGFLQLEQTALCKQSCLFWISYQNSFFVPHFSPHLFHVVVSTKAVSKGSADVISCVSMSSGFRGHSIVTQWGLNGPSQSLPIPHCPRVVKTHITGAFTMDSTFTARLWFVSCCRKQRSDQAKDFGRITIWKNNSCLQGPLMLMMWRSSKIKVQRQSFHPQPVVLHQNYWW